MRIASCELSGRTGHEAGRQLLAALYREATGESLPEIRVTDRGKPYFVDSPWHFSISHTKRRGFCVLSEVPVGLDAEEMDRRIDLRLAEEVTLKAGEFRLLPLGLAIALPQGYEAHLAPRSSTFKNYGILQTNSVGVVDCSYCGDNDQWHMPVYATRDVTIEKGARICQFRIMENQPQLHKLLRSLPDRTGQTVGTLQVRLAAPLQTESNFAALDAMVAKNWEISQSA